MYPTNKNLISGISSFLNKQFGVPLPTSNISPTPTGQNMSYAPNPNQNMSYANPSSTNPAPTVIKPPVEKSKLPLVEKPKLPPAGNQFVQDIYNKETGARTEYGASINAQDMLGGNPVVQGGRTAVNQFGGASTETTAPQKPPESPYLAYLRSMFDPEALKTAQGNIQDLSKRTSGELLRNRTREDELRKNEIGQLEIGQQYQMGEEERLSNRSLADLAIAKGTSIDVYNQMINAGKSVYEAEQAQAAIDREQVQLDKEKKIGFTLGEGQTRYDFKGNIIAGGGSARTDAYTPGADPTADAYAEAVLSGKTKLENIPEKYRGAVAQALTGKDIKQPTSPYLLNVALQGRQAVSGLMKIAQSNPRIFGKSAALPIPNALRSDAYRNYEAQLDYLRGNVIPAALTAMREASTTGGALGQVSDREGAWLASSLGALNMNQSSGMILEQLKLVDESMKRWQDAVNKYKDENKDDNELWNW